MFPLIDVIALHRMLSYHTPHYGHTSIQRTFNKYLVGVESLYTSRNCTAVMLFPFVFRIIFLLLKKQNGTLLSSFIFLIQHGVLCLLQRWVYNRNYKHALYECICTNHHNFDRGLSKVV